jgi:hypothetical protein
MRRTLLILCAAAACSRGDAPADTTVASSTTAATPAAATLTAADLQGDWAGTGRPETSDSVTSRWIVSRTSDSTGVLSYEGSTTKVNYSMRFDADSMVATSEAYNDPAMPKGAPKVLFHSVGRLKGDTLVGTSRLVLAAKPDSVIGRGRWEATRKP